MKLFAIILLAFVFLASANQSLAYTTYYNYGTGYGTSQNIGNTSYYNDSYGTYGTNRYVGNSSYYNYNYSNPSYGSIAGSTQRVGNSTYYYGDVQGSSRSIGNTTYYTLNGNDYSCRKTGYYTYCN